MQKAAPHHAGRVVCNVCASMKAEGYHTPPATQKECYEAAYGARSADELVKAYIQAYKKQP